MENQNCSNIIARLASAATSRPPRPGSKILAAATVTISSTDSVLLVPPLAWISKVSNSTSTKMGSKDDHCGKRCRSGARSEEHTSELQSRPHLVCRLLLEKKKE